jgi:multiple sugar transport system permease protein
MKIRNHHPETIKTVPSTPPNFNQTQWQEKLGKWVERITGSIFIWPAVLVVLVLGIFPLLVSLYLSLSRLKLVKGGIEFHFIGFANFQKLFFGSDQTHFLGVVGKPSLLGWLFFSLVVVLLGYSLVRTLTSQQFRPRKLIGSLFSCLLAGLITWLLVTTLGIDGRPGTLVVTLLYVFVDIIIQYILGLGLAILVTQKLPGRRFFRVIFLLPMMITPVGIGYMFRMMTDTTVGPITPIWQAAGLASFSWVNYAWGARAAVMISDIWQWTPFMFIVLLAALEGQSIELIDAAKVDGANAWKTFWYITLPQILPVSSTLILIRMIEAFKIIDLPNILTNGGPGTATESLTLQAFFKWRALDLGGSAAIAYTLLFLVTFIGISYVNLVRRRFVESS